MDFFLVVSTPTQYVVSALNLHGVIEANADFIFWVAFLIQGCMWFKLFDWLRLFQKTAIYPILLTEVFYDIAPFIVMMVVILGFFGNGLNIFQSMTTYSGHPDLQ